jgi:hypothetical protein
VSEWRARSSRSMPPRSSASRPTFHKGSVLRGSARSCEQHAQCFSHESGQWVMSSFGEWSCGAASGGEIWPAHLASNFGIILVSKPRSNGPALVFARESVGAKWVQNQGWYGEKMAGARAKGSGISET